MKSVFMQMAYDLAKKSFERGQVPVGAIIIDKHKNILSATHNNIEASSNATSHAEILAINQACEKIGSKRLIDCEIYVTLEPCPMCAYAISIARIKRLYFAAYDIKGGGVVNNLKVFDSPSCFHKPEIYGGIMENESSNLLKRFFKGKR